MANSPILQIPQVTANQAAKEVTINDGVSILERSLNDSVSIDLSAGNATVTLSDYTKFMLLKCEGHIVPRTLNVPASKRFFMVFNDGSSNVTVDPGPGTTVVVPSGSYCVIVNDGVDLHLISDSAASGGVTSFLDLPDTPNSYISFAGQAVVVKGTEDGLEFGSFAVAFADISDGPGAPAGDSLKFLRVNTGATAVEYVTAPGAFVDTFRELTDAPASFTGQGSKIVAVNSLETALEFIDLPEATIAESRPVTDGTNLGFESGDFTGWSEDAGAGWSVETTYTGVDSPPEGTKFAVHDGAGSGDVALSQIIDLTGDASNAELDDGTEVVVVVATATPDNDTASIRLEFLTGADSFISAYETDEFTSYPSSAWFDRTARATIPVGTRHVKVVLKAFDGGDLVTAYAFDDVRITIRVPIDQVTDFTDLADVPSSYSGQGSKKVKVNSGATALEFVTDSFIGLTDVPANYTSAGSKKLRVNSGATAVEFVVDNLDSLTDVDLSTPATSKQILEYDTASSNFKPKTRGAVNTQITDYTLALVDAYGYIQMNKASANDLTVPANATIAFPIGTEIKVEQTGIGVTSIVAAGGVTINTDADSLDMPDQYAVGTLKKVASDVWTFSLGSGSGSAVAVDDEGGEVLATAVRLNFTGAGVTVTDGGAGEAVITVPGGSAGESVIPGLYLIVNEGFEAGGLPPTGWTAALGSPDWTAATQPESEPAHGGTKSANHYGNTTPAKLTKEFDLTSSANDSTLDAGGEFTFVGWRRSPTADTSKFVVVFKDGTGGATIDTHDTTGGAETVWTLDTFTMDLPAGTRAIEIQCVVTIALGTLNFGMFDDISVTLGVRPFAEDIWFDTTGTGITGDNVQDALEDLDTRITDIFDAFQPDEAGQFAALTEKTTPDDNDWLVIEDSADSNNKKKLKIVNLAGASGSGGFGYLDNGAMVVPASGSFTLLSGGGGVSATKGDFAEKGCWIKLATAADGHSGALYRTIPSTPYTIDVLMAMEPAGISNFSMFGIFISDGTKYRVAGPSGNNGNSYDRWDIMSQSALGTYSADTSQTASHITMVGAPIWLRLTDNGTTVKWFFSYNGENWIEMNSETRTTYTSTPTRVGVALFIQQPNITKDAYLSVYSYEEH